MATSRVSTAHMYRTAQSQVAAAREKEVKTAEKASTLKEINRPSENSTGWVRAQGLKDDVSVKDTISRNAGLANSVLNVTEGILSQLQEFVQRAHELAIPAASQSLGTSETRAALGAEVKALYESAIRALNTRYGGRTLLGGHQTRGPAFDESGAYLGDDGKFEIEVNRNLIVPINIDARRVIQGQGMDNGVDIPEVLKRVYFGMEMNDPEIVRGALPELLRGLEQLSLGRSELGARMSEISRAITSIDAEKIEDLTSISKVEEADAVKAFSELTRDQSVLQAAMSTTQKILTADPTSVFFK